MKITICKCDCCNKQLKNDKIIEIDINIGEYENYENLIRIELCKSCKEALKITDSNSNILLSPEVIRDVFVDYLVEQSNVNKDSL